MHRRDLLRSSAAIAAAPLAGPALAQPAAGRTLRFVPNSDLAVIDPIFTAAYVTRLHAMMVFDTLYALDEDFVVRPQMVVGHRQEDGGLTWRLTLREGLRFHDGEPVLARDVVASLQRWGRVDAFGQTLFAATAELDAPGDREVRFRLRSPFPMLPDALGKASAFIPAIMPARLASAGTDRPLTECVGSGPFRYVAAERADGVRTVYERFSGYVPRAEGRASFLAGPKVARVNRVEWVVLPDDATTAAALQNGEVDWWERPQADYVALLRRRRDIVLDVVDPTGFMGIVRFNHLQPPFHNPAVRRAALHVISQADLLNAVAGSDRALWNDKVGIFCPESPMANDAGLDVLTGPRDPAAARRALAEAGYRDEPVVFLTPSNNQATHALCLVAADALQRGGFAVQLTPIDFTNWLQRRNNRGPADRGGWNATATFLPGTDLWDPAGHLAIRGNGARAWTGWPDSPRLEELRAAWFTAPDLPARQAIARELQQQVWQDVPYIPGGRWRQTTAYRRGITGMLRGAPLFHNLTMG